MGRTIADIVHKGDYLEHCRRMQESGITRKEARLFFQALKSQHDTTLCDYNRQYVDPVYPKERPVYKYASTETTLALARKVDRLYKAFFNASARIKALEDTLRSNKQ